MNVSILIYTCGIYSIAFAVFHALFPRLFNWKNDLKKLTVANRAIIRIANLRLIYIFLLIAAICFCFPYDLVNTPLGRFILGGVSLFWLGRTIEQFIFIRVNNIMVHVLTAIFILGTLLFALPLFI
jgi:hypothetical protein